MNITSELFKDPPVHLINTAESVFIQMAYLKLMQEQLIPVKERLLKMIKAVDKRTGEAVTDYRHTYRLSAEQFSEWYEEYRHEIAQLGFKQDKYQKEGICPFLEAETLLMNVQRALVLALSEYTGTTWEMLTCRGNLGLLDTYLDLHLTWLAEHVDKKRRMAAAKHAENITGEPVRDCKVFQY